MSDHEHFKPAEFSKKHHMPATPSELIDMRNPALSELPPSPAGKTGWPWTEKTPQWPIAMPNGSPWPRITIVTPSYNQGPFIEETIRSVLAQGYPNLEYMIIDGGSTDDSVDIIKKYAPWLTYWVSEKDRGQSDAIDKGFKKATGEIMAYINSDDRYMPYTFRLIAQLIGSNPDVDWITGHSGFLVDSDVISPRHKHCYAYNARLFKLGFHTPWFFGIPQQVSTFWRKALYVKAGNVVNHEFYHAMDFNLWIRMAQFSVPVFLPAAIAQLRQQPNQKSRNTSSFPEIENSGYKFWPYWMRKWVFCGMNTFGIRGLIRRLMFNGTAQQFYWNVERDRWERKIVSVF